MVQRAHTTQFPMRPFKFPEMLYVFQLIKRSNIILCEISALVLLSNILIRDITVIVNAIIISDITVILIAIIISDITVIAIAIIISVPIIVSLIILLRVSPLL